MKTQISQATLDACAARDRAWHHAEVCDQCETAWRQRTGKYCETGSILVNEFFGFQEIARRDA